MSFVCYAVCLLCPVFVMLDICYDIYLICVIFVTLVDVFFGMRFSCYAAKHFDIH